MSISHVPTHYYWFRSLICTNYIWVWLPNFVIWRLVLLVESLDIISEVDVLGDHLLAWISSFHDLNFGSAWFGFATSMQGGIQISIAVNLNIFVCLFVGICSIKKCWREMMPLVAQSHHAAPIRALPFARSDPSAPCVTISFNSLIIYYLLLSYSIIL